MKCARMGLALLVTMFLASALGAGLLLAQAPADRNFSGRVYDLDYLEAQGWTQVLVKSAGGNSELVATTQSERLQQLLEVALLNATEALVTYREGKAGKPAKLQTAVLGPTSGCSDKGCVEEVRCSAAEATAISRKKAVEYLDVDDHGLIARVKINVP